MLEFRLDNGGLLRVEPSVIDAVTETQVESRRSPSGVKTLVEIVLHSGRSYTVLDEDGTVLEQIGKAKADVVTPAERVASALEALGLQR